ncbi:histidine phosphatase family protein [Sulfitobacter sp. S0837]|uniref:histidine phosphatase family protein n=1 Tax=Sulfitobacter maritimus TaxID=2741719 RepID=UPI001582D82C|nr:histidine phosphatase family protein [Sulfitobacter maritimus]NUH63824.1 histidine phosphatase family protein [Sulfitobacter maritimus]
MTVWHWVRHGPTHEKNFVGWRDVPADLSDAAALARLNAHLPREAVLLSSDLSRAVATADALALPSRARLPNEHGLRELHFGAWDGLHFKEVAARDPDLSRAYWETPGDVVAPEGESWNQTKARVDRVVARINTAHPQAHVIAVAHFGVILTQIQQALGTEPLAAMAHKIDNLSVTHLSHKEGQWQVHKINDVL